MSKHTPGPWHAGDKNGNKKKVFAKEGSPMGDGLRLVADCAVSHINGSSNSLANARLVAAAPDMLEALKGVVAVADRKTVEFDRARAAIAKAEAV